MTTLLPSSSWSTLLSTLLLPGPAALPSLGPPLSPLLPSSPALEMAEGVEVHFALAGSSRAENGSKAQEGAGRVGAAPGASRRGNGGRDEAAKAGGGQDRRGKAPLSAGASFLTRSRRRSARR